MWSQAVYFSAIDANNAFILLIGSGQNLDQRGFAGAVFSNETMNLAFLNNNVHIVERLHSGECLSDAAHFKNHIIVQVFTSL